jgi:fucose 4-O-acetylase-like acetyltransferase
VVVNHAGPFAFGPAYTEVDRILRSRWVDFHVPAFVFVSGFLYHRAAPVPARAVGERLARIVLPYLVASLVGIGSGAFRPPAPLWLCLATGSAIGIYYYVFVMACLIPLVWPLSRLPTRVAEALLAALLLRLALAVFWPGLLPTLGWFWAVRNPLGLAPLFLLGWVARARLPELAALARGRTGLVAGLAAATAVLYVGFVDSLANAGARGLGRTAYTCAVMALLALASAGRPLPRAVRALGDATLTIYLYHIMVYVFLGYLGQTPPALRIPTLAALGLAGGLAVAFGGRTLLGPRARWVTGA